LRSRSLDSVRAPAPGPMRGASAAATVDLPDPERPPMATSAAGSGVALLDRGRRDMRADGGAQRHEEGQERQGGLVAAEVEIVVHDEIGFRLQAAVHEVHEEEGEIVEEVDRGDRVIELYAVKEDGPPILEEDVAQVQIAVRPAHEAAEAARVEQGAMRLGSLAEGAVERRDLGAQEEARLCQRRLVDGENVGHPVGAGATVRLAGRVEARDPSGEALEHRLAHFSPLRQPVEQRVPVEAAHLDDRVDQRTVATEGEAVARPGDPAHAEIVVRRGPAFSTTSFLQQASRRSGVEKSA
jgi:hypothetical protein